jgi:uncharacterized protein
MQHHVFPFHGADLVARADGALYWPAEGALIVADLHLGKAGRLARRGGALLPPYGETATLDRLAAALAGTAARRVIVLGDAFDDAESLSALPAAARERLGRLAAGRDWLWITGNHDEGADWAGAELPGKAVDETELRGITLRHVASRGPDISAHYHPAVRFMGVRRPAFLIGAEHLILPAFGQYTGGLDATDPALASLVGHGKAVLTGTRALALPWPLPEG